MRLLVDVGNTRTKWVLSENGHFLSEVGSILNENIESSDMAVLASKVTAVLVACVAGKAVEGRITALLAPSKQPVIFVQSIGVACGIVNRYIRPNRLGVDRWMSLIAAYDMYNASCLVVNAGTAVTIDALMVNHYEQKVEFVGGVIMPGVWLMQDSLNTNAAQLPKADGVFESFPKSTENAIHTGCILAISGAIELQWHSLYEAAKVLPRLYLSGGDAMLISQHLPQEIAKHTFVVDNLVLRGLMRLEREIA